MGYGVAFRADNRPNKYFLEAAIEEVVAANADWFWREWQAGREPPCCLECADIRYQPDRPGVVTELVGAGQVLEDEYASCQSVAAYYAGRERAIAGWNDGSGKYDMRYRVVLVPQRHTNASSYFHALVEGPNGTQDPTKGMRR